MNTNTLADSKINWLAIIIAFLLVVASALAGWLLGINKICEDNGAVLANDQYGFTCLLPEQLGKTCTDINRPNSLVYDYLLNFTNG